MPLTTARRTIHLIPLPTWVKPQLAALVKQAPDGSDWLHEIKLDGYRMHARLDAGRVQILTGRGNIWTDKYPAIANPVAGLPPRFRARAADSGIEVRRYPDMGRRLVRFDRFLKLRIGNARKADRGLALMLRHSDHIGGLPDP